MRSNRNPARLLKLWDICDQCVVTTTGALWGGARVFGPDPTTQTDESWALVASGLYANFPKLPDNTFLQFVWVHQEVPREAYDTEPGEMAAGDEKMFAYQRRRRAEFLFQRRLTSRELYVFWSARQGVGLKEFRKITQADHRAAVAEVAELETTVRGVLGRSDLEVQRLGDKELFQLFVEWIDPHGTGAVRRTGIQDEQYDDLDDLDELGVTLTSVREQLFHGEASWSDEAFLIGGTGFKVLAAKQLPPETRIDVLGKLEFAFDTRLIVNIHVPPKALTEATFRQQRRFATSLAFRAHGPADTEAEEAVDEMDDVDRELVHGNRLVKVGVQGVVWAKKPRALEERAKIVRHALRDVDVEIYEERYAHDREFMKTLPAMAAGFDRWRLVTSRVAADVIPVSQYSRGDRNPQLLFQNDLSGELFGYSLREWVRANDNWKVLGASGAGKSVLVNMLLIYGMLSGPYKGRVSGIDYAGPTKSSFKTASEVLGGKYISISGDGQKINPWKAKAAVYRDGRVDPEALGFLTRISNILLYNVGHTKEEAIFEALIQRGIKEVYERHENDSPPVYGDLLRVFEGLDVSREEEDRRLKLVSLLGKMLDGPEAELLNARTRVDNEGDFITYDLFGLRNYDERVREAVAGVVMQHVRETAFDGRPDRYKYICLEEVTNLVAVGLKDMVEELITTARAHGTSVGVITQEYDAYRRSALAGTINLNTTSTFLMSHKNALNAMRPVIEDMDLNATEAEHFRGLRAVKGEYSELLLKTQCWSPNGSRDVTAKLRFELSPFDYQVVTSDARDRARQNRLQAAYPNAPRAEILDYLAYPRPKGGTTESGVRQ